ncbi:hypothetical protein QBZ16_004020 [Prototheca wickerhamii]|uniref:Translation initiation factor IF-2, mitochondrial n=1 Tax=Prototheca wickerhamii TaxID=3111 RepID=A0AAD9MIB5_PROWI|nr:hypothetical protein QBZ16_004020 [Prototheca wickerhamii]
MLEGPGQRDRQQGPGRSPNSANAGGKRRGDRPETAGAEGASRPRPRDGQPQGRRGPNSSGGPAEAPRGGPRAPGERQAKHPRSPEEQVEWLKKTGRWVDPAVFAHKRSPEEHRAWLREQGRLGGAAAAGGRAPPRGGAVPTTAEAPPSRPRGRARQDGAGAASTSTSSTSAAGRGAGSGRRPRPRPSRPRTAEIPPEVTVQQLAQLYGVARSRLEEVLGQLGCAPSSEEEVVGEEDAELAALELGVPARLSAEAVAARDARLRSRAPDAAPRPAVVTVMGHVDHGKTSLLDALRSSSVAAREAGGITQHIGAFFVPLPGSGAALTFLDTPGHAAFSAMRSRGASVTDIVVLVVAADDGVMPQTEEALAHARAAGVPIVVALTKCDLPAAQPARVRGALLGLGVVEVAAPKGQGLDALEEALLLQAELLDLQASPSAPARGTVIEARLDKGRGPVATVVVREGTLRVGDIVVAGAEWGRVRAVGNGGPVPGEARPGEPAEATRWPWSPDERRAQALSAARARRAQSRRHDAAAEAVAARAAAAAATAEREATEKDADNTPSEPERTVIPVVVKADVQGSVEAVAEALAALSCRELELRVVHAGVGPVTASDVQLAVPLGARIVAFGVRAGGAEVEAAIKRHGLSLHRHAVIYKLLEELGEVMLGAAPRVARESVAGEASVLQTFEVSGGRGRERGVVAGCRVGKGTIRSGERFRVLRAGRLVHEGRCLSLRRLKQTVDAVGRGTECGVVLEGFDDFQPGDTLECLRVDMVAPESLSGGEQR